MNKVIITLLFLMSLSPVLFAGGQHIIPADKAKIQRYIGESVFVECKNLSPFSTNCQVDCGNGRHYRKAKGYCHYLSKGNFLLKISTRYRGRNYAHTAVVSITEKGKNSQRRASNFNKNQTASAKTSEEKTAKSSSQNQLANKLPEKTTIFTEIDESENLNAIANQANIDLNNKQLNDEVIQKLTPPPGFISNEENFVNQQSLQPQFVQQ